MANILPENETFTFEDREYINPQVSLDEQNAFIDNYRQTQQQNNNEIIQQARNLGTEVPSNLGGLVGGEGYWTSRIQTPQTNAMVSQLRAANQAQALTKVLENEQAIWKKRYQDAYRNYQKRSNSSGGGGGGDTLSDILEKLGVDVNGTDNDGTGNVNEGEYRGPGYINSVEGGLNVYTTLDGEKWTLRNPDQGDEVLLGMPNTPGGGLKNEFPDGTPLTNGATYQTGGKMFIYIENEQYPNGTFFRVADTPTKSYN